MIPRFLLLIAIGLSTPAAAQHVQFIHTGSYADLDSVDVYRNGELWLDNFSYLSATPFEVWPTAADVVLTRWNDPTPLLSASLLFSRRDTTALILTGDPRGRVGHPPLEFFRIDDCKLVNDYATDQSFYRTVVVSPDYPGRAVLRDYYFQDAPSGITPDVRYRGAMTGYSPAPPFRHEVDLRAPDGTIHAYSLTDWTNVFGMGMLQVTYGFFDPPSDDALHDGSMTVVSDGRIVWNPPNHARIQFVQNMAFAEAESIDIRVTHVDSLGPHMVRYERRNLAFRTATPYVELPAGLTISGNRRTAPDLLVEVFAGDRSEPVFRKTIHLIYDGVYSAMLSGDPLSRPGHPPIELSLISDWTPADSRPDTTSFIFLNGLADGGIPVRVFRPDDETRALAGFIPTGSGVIVDGVPALDDTLVVTRALSGREVTRFRAELTAATDSTVLLVASGFLDPPGIASADADFALFAVYPSGGAFAPLPLYGPRRIWTYWWFWAIGLGVAALLGLAVNQALVMRLRARERELGALVDERTRELQAEKDKTEAQALRLTELDEAKNRFFANISHEFRTPLTLILGPVQDALDGYFGALEPRLSSQMGVMHRSARRLLRLINQLLDLSKLESGKMSLTTRLDDVAAFTADLARSFVPLAERRGIALAVEVPRDVLACRFDTDAMEKVLSNLLSNALKFTPDGGKVQLNMEADADHIRIVVRDNGPGISDEDLARIFERFQQADTSIRRRFEGSGIGLTLAKELVELHEGSIAVESVIGFGTAFTVTLPRSGEPLIARTDTGVHIADAALLEGALLSRPVADLEAEADDAAGATVLVVEDNQDVRTYIRQHLAERYKVIEAFDGQDGLEKARSESPALVLSDVMMPRMDGYELCRTIKGDEDLRHTPVILLTAKAGDADTIEGLQGGADAYVAKPFSMAALQLRIANLIASRQQMREQFSREVIVHGSDVDISSDEETFLNDALDRINAHLGDSNLSIDWLADDVGISRRQFERRIQEATHMTPAQLVRKMRLERASQLLRAKAGTVAEVAYAVGFRSPSHFAKLYKAAYGESPTSRKRAAPDAPASLTGSTISHYEIGDKLGSGGMGVIYRAKDIILDREVAVKVLPARWTADDDANARFMREAKAVSALDHPNVCAIYDIGETDEGALFMVMPYYTGQTIGAMMATGAIDLDRALKITVAVSDGLAAAHAKGIVHRDIKPENVLVTGDGAVKILDFGVAKLSEDMQLTQPGTTVGTAAYMSPEQLRGEEAGPPSDLWSLGVVLYEMLAGHAPFDGEYAAARSYQILNEPHRRIAGDLPYEVRDLVDRMLEKGPEDRPSEAAVVGDVIRTIEGQMAAP